MQGMCSPGPRAVSLCKHFGMNLIGKYIAVKVKRLSESYMDYEWIKALTSAAVEFIFGSFRRTADED